MSVQIQNKIEALQASYAGGVFIDPVKSVLTDLNVDPILSRFGIEDNLGVQNRLINMNNFSLSAINASDLTLLASGGGLTNGFKADNFSTSLSSQHSSGSTSKLQTGQNYATYIYNNGIGGSSNQAFSNLLGTYTIPLSVNGNFADVAGNITIPTGGSFIPLTGTELNNPITGPLEILSTNFTALSSLSEYKIGVGNILSLEDASTKNYISFTPSSVIISAESIVAGDGGASITFTGDDAGKASILISGSKVLGFKGIIGIEDFSINYNPLTYVQKVYVDKTHGSTLLEYVDNANALANGLQIGNFYRTGDLLKVVH